MRADVALLVAAALLSACGSAELVASDAAATSCGSTDHCTSAVTTEPLRRSEHTAVYLPERLEMIVFGGTTAIAEACGFPDASFIDETWLYDDNCNAWFELSVTGPSPRGRHMAAASPGAMWIFGGRFRGPGTSSGDYVLYDDLHRFDAASRSFAEVSPVAARPPARASGALVWDSRRERLWLFGGTRSPSGLAYDPMGDVWSFDPATASWQEHQTAGAVPPRLSHGMTYDSKRDRLVVYAGSDERGFTVGTYLADLWALDLETLDWQLLHDGTSQAPEARLWSAIVYDSRDDTYIAFGGHDDQALGNRNDTWRFDPDAGQWSRLYEGDRYNSPPNGVCDFPPDFTVIDATLPERRSSHTLVWSEPCGHALLFAGKTDCGATHDLWRFQAGAWHEVRQAIEGEVCLRWRTDPALCNNLCN
jgi:hypothetical protein